MGNFSKETPASRTLPPMEHTDEPRTSKVRRQTVGRVLRHRLFDEVRSTCPNPTCQSEGVSVLELHHIDGDRSLSVFENLLALCSSCHTQSEKRLISESDLVLWKRMLQHGHHPRLGPRAIATLPPTPTLNVGQNYGQVAQNITNKFVQPEAGATQIILPGSIGSDPACYNYIEYLIGRLAEFRAAGSSYGQKRRGAVHPGVIKNQIKNERGALPKNLDRELADGLAQELKDKIDDTALGRNRRSKGMANYHSFEVHLVRMKGKKRTKRAD
jgi:hypothetical protein